METGVSAKNYTLDDLFTDLEAGIWSEAQTGKPTLTFTAEICKRYMRKN
jgi:hypothetical protein